MATVKLSSLRKRYGKVEIIKGVDIDIDDGEFVVFVGPSGCGKSTLLRMIAGLEEISDGELRIDNQVVNSLEPKARGIAMVFQSYALYPHKTVYDNMAFGLQIAKTPKAEIEEKVRNAARILRMENLLERKPSQLSGGQRQRVAIGRAIVRNPKVFLFDEPLSNLDAALRVNMRAELSKLHRDLKATMIYVTHDQVEAMTLADKIVVLEGGIVRQAGSPLELYHKPKNLFVAGFIGSPKMNFLSVTVASVEADGVTVASPDFPNARIPVEPGAVKVGDKVTLGVRPEDIHAGDGEGIAFAGKVELVERLGHQTIVETLLPSSQSITGLIDGTTLVQPGDTARLSFRATNAHVFMENGEALTRRVVPDIANFRKASVTA